MKQGLSLRVSQHLALTPQLQQSIRLLQLSTLELNQEIEQLLDDNPFLERSVEDEGGPEPLTATSESSGEVYSASEGVGTSASAGTETAERQAHEESAGADGESGGDDDTYATEPDWSAEGSDISFDGEDWGNDAGEGVSGGAPGTRNAHDGDDESQFGDWSQSPESLTEHLHRQALGLRLSEEDTAALRFLIESLNEDGYLEDSLEMLVANFLGVGESEQHQMLLSHFQVALGLLQNLEPSGVGARNLSECLCLQIDALAREGDASTDAATRAVARRLCVNGLELLARRDVKRMMALTEGTEEQVRAAMAFIARLEPKPGRRFVQVEQFVVVPDVIVRHSGRAKTGPLVVQLNADVMPRLRVHDMYAQVLKGNRREGNANLQQRLQEARWFIKNIQQRFDTILRVASAIVDRQKSFFVHGELAMRPLVLREIADELGLHESTISRVTTAKYMATPMGTYELKYFFGSSLGTEAGGSASSTAVRALIKQFVAAEDALRPLSDSKLSEMLKEQGIECARRTVAKYREALRIAPAQMRKTV